MQHRTKWIHGCGLYRGTMERRMRRKLASDDDVDPDDDELSIDVAQHF